MVQRRSGVARKNGGIPGNVMFADQVEVAGQRSVGDCAVSKNARLECVIGAQQAEGGRGGEQFRIRRRSLPGSGVALIINDRAVLVLDQDGPGVGRHGSPGENSVHLVWDRRRRSDRRERKRDEEKRKRGGTSHGAPNSKASAPRAGKPNSP